MNKISLFLARNWQLLLAYTLGTAVVAAILGLQLDSLLPATAQEEIAALEQSASFGELVRNPLFMPHKLMTYAFLQLPLSPLLAIRLASAVFGGLGILLFYRVVKAWYTPRVSILATMLFASSSWLLHAARLGTPSIMYLSVLSILWAGLLFRSYKSHPGVVPLICGIVGVTIYVPGFLWFVLAAAVWQRKQLPAVFSAISAKLKVLSVSLILILAAPLAVGAVLRPRLILPLLGIPDSFPKLAQLAGNLIDIPKNLVYQGPADPVSWLPNTPFIDFFGLIMLVLGLYALRFSFGLDRIKTLVGLLVVSVILIVIGSAETIILQPLVYLAIASGIAFMLQQWFTVFPRNPVARLIAIAVITGAVGMSGFYQLSHYFIAWRLSPEVRQAYSHEVPANLLQ